MKFNLNILQEAVFHSSKNEFPFPRNPAILEAVDDLTDLSFLHEPEGIRFKDFVIHNPKISRPVPQILEKKEKPQFCGFVANFFFFFSSPQSPRAISGEKHDLPLLRWACLTLPPNARAGIVLVAINPYSSLALYSSDVIAAYSGKAIGTYVY